MFGHFECISIFNNQNTDSPPRLATTKTETICMAHVFCNDSGKYYYDSLLLELSRDQTFRYIVFGDRVNMQINCFHLLSVVTAASVYINRIQTIAT